ncbi:unnamed protein product [Rotaria socialis]|uniref:Ionotropic glutamate receptor C-terminal domain-containing protein n=3 Tax=Rotaria socialis TaxID=392032 RepID=A0A820VBK1_9BILA|nr:unnamed protein product [Rotaria socialis]
MLLALQSYNSSTGNHKKLKSQWLNQNHRSATSLWPSFPNDNNSYVYLLGLFLEQRFTTGTEKHFQTSVEPLMFQAAVLLSQKLNITINGKRIAYHVESTSGRNVIEALDLTCRAIQEYKILGIVGPEYSSEAKTLASFGNRAGLPVIGYSTTEPELSDRNSYKTFYRLSASDVFIAQALLKLFKQYLWNSTNIIYQGDSYGQGGLHALDEAFGNEVKISRSIRFDLFTERIDNLKRQLEESPSRIVIVMAAGNVTTKIIRQSLEVGEVMAPSFLWILTASKTLNITVYISPPFFMQSAFPNIQGKYLYEGYIHELLLLLKDKMEFNYSYLVASNETSYDELIECVENRKCEIVMADLAETATRLAKVDFSTSIYDNALRLVVRKSKHKTISPIAFLKPFSTWLWLGIIFLIYILSVILIGLYEYQEERNGIESSSLMRILGRSLYHTIGALVQRGSELQVKTLFARIQTVTVWLMSVVIVALLTSNLTIYFTAQREQPWLKSIDDLNMCQKVDCKRIGVVERSQHEEYFTKEVTHSIEMNYHRLKHPTECFTKLLDGHIDVSLADSSSAEYYTQTEYCQLELVGEPFGKTHFAVALPKYWHYKQDLDTHILELRTNGEIDRRLATYFQQRNCDVINENQPNIEDGGLTIFQTSGLFIIFGVLTGLNFMCYVMNRVGIFSSIALSVQKIRGYYGSESITVDPERVANPTELLVIDNGFSSLNICAGNKIQDNLENNTSVPYCSTNLGCGFGCS